MIQVNGINEMVDPVILLQNKITMIDKLLGNTRESKYLKDRFFQMILTP